MTEITQLGRSVQIVEKDGTPTVRMNRWLQFVTQLQVKDGTGSPEGVIEADVKALYMDTSGTAGNILYIKRDSDISGDRTQGWILI